jgi:20S proteasome alpha/beta subunit
MQLSKPYFPGTRAFSIPSAGGLKPLKSLLISLTVFTLFSTTVVAVSSAASAPIRIKGSFVIAAICKDGIIVASDSRGTLKDSQGRRVAYYDINQKIFPLGDKLIADTGYASLNDPKLSFLSALMSRFAESPLSHVNVDQLPDSYFKFVSLALPVAGAQSAKIQTLVFAGYQKDKPLLCIYDGESKGTTECRSSGFLSSPKQPIVGLKDVSSLSFKQAAEVMQRTIDDYAAAIQPGSVGGPVVIRTITPSTSEWFETPPQWPQWQAFTDLAQDYRAKRVQFHLMPGVAERELASLIDDGATWARLGQASSPEKAGANAPVIGSYRPDR